MTILVPAPADFSFVETVAAHGWRRLAPFVWQDETQTLAHVDELADGRVVRLRMHGEEGGVRIDVEGAGDEAEITRRARRMLQLDLSLADFHAHCAAHPNLAHVAACRRGRMLRSPTLFEDTVKVIATANTTWAQTVAMTARLVAHFGAPAPPLLGAGGPATPPELGAGGSAFPTPARIAAVPFDEFAAKARMGYRNAYVYTLATAIATGQLDLEAWQDASLEAPELRKRLLSLPGIGPYGAACLMLYLGKPQHVNADSVARAKLAQELGRAVTDREVHAFFAAHGEWQGLVYQFWPWRPRDGT